MRARKRFGQHFLEPVWAAKLVDLIDPRPGETFLEIGPGRGALTLPLAAKAARIVAVEIDRNLAAELRPRLPENVDLITADILAVDLRALFGRDVPDVNRLRIVGNIPYNITAPILFRLLAFRRTFAPLTDATVMVQQEVARRLLATVGTKEYGVLTILIRMLTDVRHLVTLPPGAFRPAPKVTSTVVRLIFRAPLVPVLDPPGFDALVRGIFTRRRKTILNALRPLAEAKGIATAAALAHARIDARRRPETLEVTELAALADFFAEAPK